MLKKKRKACESSPKVDATASDPRRTLWDFITPRVQGISPSIARPTMEVKDFDLTSIIVSMAKNTV